MRSDEPRFLKVWTFRPAAINRFADIIKVALKSLARSEFHLRRHIGSLRLADLALVGTQAHSVMLLGVGVVEGAVDVADSQVVEDLVVGFGRLATIGTRVWVRPLWLMRCITQEGERWFADDARGWELWCSKSSQAGKSESEGRRKAE